MAIRQRSRMNTRARRGICPTCEKRGLGKARSTSTGGWARDCLYCGDTIILDANQRALAEENNAFDGNFPRLPAASLRRADQEA